MKPELAAAIEGLYLAFAAYPLMEDVSYCRDHCVTDAEVADLHRAPLREVSADQMIHLAYNIGTWGDDEYFFHFAPRYLELAALPGGTRIPILSRMNSILAYGPPECRPAVDAFMTEWWQQAASAPKQEGWTVARELLEAVHDAGHPVEPFLAAWPTGVDADVQFAEAILAPILILESDDQFWRDINAWRYGPESLPRLTAAMATARDPELIAYAIAFLTETRPPA